MRKNQFNIGDIIKLREEDYAKLSELWREKKQYQEPKNVKRMCIVIDEFDDVLIALPLTTASLAGKTKMLSKIKEELSNVDMEILNNKLLMYGVTTGSEKSFIEQTLLNLEQRRKDLITQQITNRIELNGIFEKIEFKLEKKWLVRVDSYLVNELRLTFPTNFTYNFAIIVEDLDIISEFIPNNVQDIEMLVDEHIQRMPLSFRKKLRFEKNRIRQNSQKK